MEESFCMIGVSTAETMLVVTTYTEQISSGCYINCTHDVHKMTANFIILGNTTAIGCQWLLLTLNILFQVTTLVAHIRPRKWKQICV